MGMDQTFYVMKEKDIPIFMKKMRMYFKNTLHDYDTYDAYDAYSDILDSVEMKEIGYARKNYVLDNLIMQNFPNASSHSGGWTYISNEGVQNLFKMIAEKGVYDTYGDYELFNALRIFMNIYFSKLEDDIEREDEEPYGMVYSADW